MKLSAYLQANSLGYAAFGRLCQPAIPRVSVRQYALDLRFPERREIFEAIEKASGGQVTANDFVRAAEAEADTADEAAA